MDTAYNIRKNKTLAYLAELTTLLQNNSTFVSSFTCNSSENTIDCVNSMKGEAYCIRLSLLVPYKKDKDS